MKKKCYFTNYGYLFDKDNREELRDCWNSFNCCKSDLCNGLWCDDYSIEFNKEYAQKNMIDYINKAYKGAYAYLKEVEIDIPKDLWKDIYKTLKNDYHFKNKKEILERGFIPFDYGEIIEDYSNYWDNPDISYIKDKNGNVLKNNLIIKKENELNQETINWINEKLYCDTKIDKFNTLCGDWNFRDIDMTETHLQGIKIEGNIMKVSFEKYSPFIEDYVWCDGKDITDKEIINNFHKLNITDEYEVKEFMSNVEYLSNYNESSQIINQLEQEEIEKLGIGI